jgi:hypothetical protein
MRPPRTFKTDFWQADIALLPDDDAQLAQRIMTQATETLGGEPYHRSSKTEKSSDRQALIKHPKSHQLVMMISVVPNPPGEPPYRLRVDFFDKERAIAFPPGEITDGPGTQFQLKGERRTVVSADMPTRNVEALVKKIFAAHR